MSRVTEGIVSVALILGAVVNLAAGARRPLVEHRILAADHYAHADRAAAEVSRRVPAGNALRVVVYDGDMLDELDAGVWFDYRSRWLLYPRDLRVSRVDPDQPLTARPDPGDVAVPAGSVRFAEGEYVLFFRVSGPPTLPPVPMIKLAEDPMWVLARVELSRQRSGE